MSNVETSLTRVADALDLLTHQMRGRANIEATVTTFVAPLQEIETVAAQLRELRNIDAVSGVNLDALGAIVGEPRSGRTDDVYRIWIRARIRVNRSFGTPVDVYAVANLILGAGSSTRIREIPTGVALVDNLESVVQPLEVQRILQQTVSAGVPFYYHWRPFCSEPDAYAFTFAPGSAVVTSSDYGFGSGRLLSSLGPGDSAPPVYDPTDVVGSAYLVEHWIADDITVADGDVVTTWPGFVSDLTNAGSPLLETCAYRGARNTVNCPTNSDYMAGTAIGGMSPEQVLDLSADTTLVWVGAPKSAGTCTAIRISDGANAFVRVGVTSAGAMFAVGVQGSTYAYLESAASLVNLAAAHVFILRVTSSGAAATFWCDGVQSEHTDGSSSGAFVDPGVVLPYVTLAGAPGAQPVFTKMADFRVYSRAVTDDEAQQITRVMQRKYLDA